MIHTLDFTVTFSNGRTLSGRHTFQTGLTLISGPNGQGKSTRLEMIRFALFGSSALRGDGSDYAAIDVSLTFSVLDRKLVISRSLKTAKMLEGEGETIIATGHKAVNAKVVEIFGYGSAVFEISNCAKQKEISKLSNLPPAERRRMVDQVIGLDIVEALAAWAGREMRVIEKAADMAEASLPSVPPAPVQPEGWCPVAEIDGRRAELRDFAASKRDLEAFLKTEPAQPQAPARTIDNPNWLSILEEHERQRLRAIGDLQSLTMQLHRIPEPLLSAESIAEMRAYHEAKRAYDNALLYSHSLATAPRYTAEHLDELEHQWDHFLSYRRWLSLREAGHHHCPSCHHEWPIRADEMSALPDFNTLPHPVAPESTPPSIEKHRAQLRRYEAEAEMRQQIDATLAAGAPVKPDINPQVELNQAEAALRLLPERQRIQAEIKRVETLAAAEDLSAELADLRKLKTAWDTYNALVEPYNAWQERAKEARLALSLLGTPEVELEALEQLRDAVVAYDAMAASHARAVAAREVAEAQVTAKRREAAEWKAARTALETIRTQTKGHLLPSLGAVAGTILSQITNGVLNRVKVDDDFEVRVGDQSLATLSGSESTAANLALRIALGQILTKRVFGVFLGDEIDADMDEDRAARTAESLRALTRSGAVPQLIVVSHKRIEADHYVDV